MDDRGRALVAGAAGVGIFVLVQVGALAVLEPFLSLSVQPVEDPANPANSAVYFLGILAATGVMLLAIRYDLGWVIRGFVLFTSALLSWYALSVLVPLPFPLPALLSVGVAVALYVHPEWYVIDVAGVLMAAGAAGLFGITFGVLPAVLLLTVLAVYDAISVYGTEHMLTLAEGAMELRMPVLFVIPTSLEYSFIEATTPAEGDDAGDPGADTETRDGDPDRDADAGDPAAADGAGDSGTGGDPDGADPDPADDPPDSTADGADAAAGPLQRDALFVGLGDAVIPTVMVTSAVSFADAPLLGGPVPVNLPGLTAAVGTLLGLCALLYFVFRGRAHAGLPLLNGGAIAGYLVGATAAGIPLVEALGLGPYV